MGLDTNTKTTVLIKGALKGSQKAFSDIMDLYWDGIIKYLKSKKAPDYVLEDIALMSFTKAFDKLATYNNEFTFKTWLNTIAHNTLIDFFRKQKNTMISIDEIFTDDTGSEFRIDFKSKSLSPEEELIETQEETEIKKLIYLLQDSYSEILSLRYLKHLSYKEISDELKIPIANVKVRLLRSRRNLVNSIKAKSDINN